MRLIILIGLGILLVGCVYEEEDSTCYEVGTPEEDRYIGSLPCETEMIQYDVCGENRSEKCTGGTKSVSIHRR